MKRFGRILVLVISLWFILACETLTSSVSNVDGKLYLLGSYDTGNYDNKADGGVAEIVAFNTDKNYMYIVSGHKQELIIVEIKTDGSTKEHKRVKLSDLGLSGGEAGDMTSVAYNPVDKTLAVAVQHKDYDKAGKILILSDEGEKKTAYNAGVQPDMVTFSPDGKYVASADEGEPRKGYVDGVDPEGSVTLIDLQTEMCEIINFANVPCDKKVLIKKDSTAQYDLEPEYIAFADDSKTLYVSLQENNAIASLDVNTKKWNYVNGLGFKDHSIAGNEIDLTRLEADEVNEGKGKYIDIKCEPNVYGVYMPDGIAYVEIGGTGYILTANEGDAREWKGNTKENNYENITSSRINKDGKIGKKTEHLDVEKTNGLEKDKYYLLGARSFSIWNAKDLSLVYDSGADFEKITAEKYPNYFNSGHDEIAIDKRSNKKGPEPESVTTIKLDKKVFALIALERIGGVMLYDISNPKNAKFCDYLNNRNFEIEDIKQQGDLGPEGIVAITPEQSPTGKALVLVANEISGTVTLLEIR